MRNQTVNTLGVVTYWMMPAIETRYEMLEQAWAEQGLDPKLLPKPTGACKALHRALEAQKGPRRLPRPLAKGKHWAVVDEEVLGDDNLTHRVVATAKLETIDGVKQKLVVTGNGIASAIEAGYAAQMELINQNDLVSLMIAMARRCLAVTLRPTGGVYFIPAAGLEFWDRVCTVITRLSPQAVVYALKPEIDPTSVRAVLDAITAEAESDIATLNAELKASFDETVPLGTRALKTRSVAVDALTAKVASYASLLGQTMPGITTALEGLQIALVEAQARIESAEAGKEAAAT